MMTKPAHKDTINPPGQFINKLPSQLVEQASGQIVNPVQDKTLGDYIARKQLDLYNHPNFRAANKSFYEAQKQLEAIMSKKDVVSWLKAWANNTYQEGD